MKKRGYDGVTMESDCQQLVNIILNESEWPSVAPELDEIMLSSQFQDLEFSFVPCTLNFCADSLAKGERSHVNCFSLFLGCRRFGF